MNPYTMTIQPPPTIMPLLFVGFAPVGKCHNKPHFECSILHLRCNELQSSTLPVLLLLHQIPHLGIVLSETLLARPRTILLHGVGGCMGLLTAHTEADWGSLAQWLLAKRRQQGWGNGARERKQKKKEMHYLIFLW